MRTGRQLGLDELMIVNPGVAGLGAVVLSADDNVSQAQGLEQADPLQGLGQFFIGDDGTLYQVEGFDSNGSTDSAEAKAESLGELGIRSLAAISLEGTGCSMKSFPSETPPREL